MGVAGMLSEAAGTSPSGTEPVPGFAARTCGEELVVVLRGGDVDGLRARAHEIVAGTRARDWSDVT